MRNGCLALKSPTPISYPLSPRGDTGLAHADIVGMNDRNAVAIGEFQPA
jgi:hypothetical protein